MMLDNFKNIVKKNFFLQKKKFDIKKNFLKTSYLIDKNVKTKFKLLIHQYKFNEAHAFYLKNILNKKKFSFDDFNDYLSLSMRLRKKENYKKVYNIIFSFCNWSPRFYIFLLNNYENKFLVK